MARGRRQAPTISLFSFQDIVTSVMGIMLIVTLLLALDLVNRETQRATAAEDDLPDRPAVDLQQTITQLEHRKSQLSAAIEQNSAELDASGRMSAEELQKTIGEAERQAGRLREGIEKLAKRRDELEQVRREQAMQAPQLESMKEQLASLGEILEAEQARLEAAKQDTRVRFSIPRGSNRSGWLVDLKTAAITVAPLGRDGKAIVFAESTEARNRDAFLQWLRRTKDTNIYLFFVVRPGTTETFHAIRQTVDSMRVSFGFDVVGENQSVVEPAKGEKNE